MPGKIEDSDTRYFVEIDLSALELTRVGFDQKQSLHKGRQEEADVHRLFLTKGQYNKFVSRCEEELRSILDCQQAIVLRDKYVTTLQIKPGQMRIKLNNEHRRQLLTC